MSVIVTRNIPILKTKEQCRKADVIRGMCRYVSSRSKADVSALNKLFKSTERKQR